MPDARPTFHQIYMSLADSISRRSTCRRLKVGCAITSTDFRKVLAVGYNGNATGLANDCDSDEPGKCGCLHAEENAVINCDSDRNTPKIIYCTHLPCNMCAKRLINLGGVEKIVFAQMYRLKNSIQTIHKTSIKIYQYFPISDECPEFVVELLDNGRYNPSYNTELDQRIIRTIGCHWNQ